MLVQVSFADAQQKNQLLVHVVEPDGGALHVNNAAAHPQIRCRADPRRDKFEAVPKLCVQMSNSIVVHPRT